MIDPALRGSSADVAVDCCMIASVYISILLAVERELKIRESLIIHVAGRYPSFSHHLSECCFNTWWSGRCMPWLWQARPPFLFVGVAVLESVRQSWYQSVGVLYIRPSFPDAAKLVSSPSGTANTWTSTDDVWMCGRFLVYECCLRALLSVIFILPPERMNFECTYQHSQQHLVEKGCKMHMPHCASVKSRSEEAKKLDLKCLGDSWSAQLHLHHDSRELWRSTTIQNSEFK